MQNKGDHHKLAEGVLRAMDFREASYVQGVGAFVANATGVSYKVPYPGGYHLDYHQAAAEALPDDPVMAELVALLMITSWNDAADWARRALRHNVVTSCDPASVCLP